MQSLDCRSCFATSDFSEHPKVQQIKFKDFLIIKDDK
jgi:hypothetical protein